MKQYALDQHYAITMNFEVVGYFGLYPDKDISSQLNTFYVLNPQFRGKGLFRYFLKAMINYCRSTFSGIRELRAVTRASNVASVKGLKRNSFVHMGQHMEEYSDDPKDDVLYKIYILDLSDH